MKLRKSIHSINTKFYNKFEDCDPKKLVRGDYIHVKYMSMDKKRRGGYSLRLCNRVVLLYKKKRKRNTLSYVVISLYKYERVKIRFVISSVYMIKINFIRKAQKSFSKLFL